MSTIDRSPSRILAIANQKGGVGKTTTAINLGAALAAVGRRILLIDLDPQGNASTGLGIDASSRSENTYDVMRGDYPLSEAVKSTTIPGLYVAPAVGDLSGVDVEIADAVDRTRRLRNILTRERSVGPLAEFDTILIDCPPSLNLLTVNAMTAADAVLVPLQCEFFALEGLSQLLKTIERVKANLNPDLRIEGVVLTMQDRRNNLSVQVEQDVRNALGALVYDTVIPRNVRLSEAPSFGLPAIIYDQKCQGSQAYQTLAGEVLRREKEVA